MASLPSMPFPAVCRRAFLAGSISACILPSLSPAQEEERQKPAVINGDRRQRIARGSGTSVQDVNRLLKQHAQLRKMMKGLKGMSGRMNPRQLRRALPFLER